MGEARLRHRARSRRSRTRSTRAGDGRPHEATDGGGGFKGVFEHETVASTGAVAVAPSNPKVVWLGTGGGRDDRNSSGWGRRRYRSTDAGETWTHAGLPERQGHRAHRRPSHRARTAWVAAAGDSGRRAGSAGIYDDRRRPDWRLVTAPLRRPRGGGDRHRPEDPECSTPPSTRRRTPWSFTAGPDATDGKDQAAFRDHRRRHDLAQAGAAASGAGPHRARVYAKDPRSSTPSCRARRRAGPSTRCAAAAGRLPLGRRRRDLDAHEPAHPGRYFSQIRVDRQRQARASWGSPFTSPTTAAARSARTSSRRCTRTTTPWPSIRETPSGSCSARTADRTRATRRARAGSISAGWRPASSIASTWTRRLPTASAAACRTTRTGWARAARARRTGS